MAGLLIWAEMVVLFFSKYKYKLKAYCIAKFDDCNRGQFQVHRKGTSMQGLRCNRYGAKTSFLF